MSKKQFTFKTVKDDGYIIKDNGHTMFPEDVTKTLNRQKTKLETLLNTQNELLDLIEKWSKTFQNSIPFQQYAQGVFEVLNKRYSESHQLLKKYGKIE